MNMVSTYFKSSLVMLVALTLVIAPSAQGVARTSTSRFNESLDGVITLNPCTGEDVTLSGVIRHVLHVTDNGKSYHVVSNSNLQNVKGIGTTGTRYRASGGERSQVTFRKADGFPQTGSFQFPFRLISQGSAPNFSFIDRFHYTINAKGELTAFFTKTSQVCRGR